MFYKKLLPESYIQKFTRVARRQANRWCTSLHALDHTADIKNFASGDEFLKISIKSFLTNWVNVTFRLTSLQTLIITARPG